MSERIPAAPPPGPDVGMLVYCDHLENCSWSEPDAQNRISIISYRYCYPTISGVGIVGSLLLLLVLRDARFGGAGVYTYLRCLMLSDSAALTMAGATFLAETWQTYVDCDGRRLQPRSRAEAIWRIVFVPFANAMVGFSMGVTLWMTYDRYQAVRVPHELWRQRRPERRCGGRPLRIAATLLVSLALHMPQTLGYHVVEHCPVEGDTFYTVSLIHGAASGWVWPFYQWALQVLVRWLPAAVVLYCNSYIIVAIKRRERRVQAIATTMSQQCTESVTRRPRGESSASSCSGVSLVGVCELPRPPAPPPSPLPQRPPSASVDSARRQRQRRQEAEHRMEFLLAATAASYLVSNCLQSALCILELVYEQRDLGFQIFRAIANNVEALNFCLDFVYAIVFVRQIRDVFLCRIQQVVSVFQSILAPPSKADVANNADQ
ncbi:probable G-protein coupled receptor B0563.6 [Amphibalanus amphitrite]|uniref:probable G-protein coupled receptor B0563.6 n=1 Tax=Amphibalanus amphitrite TaxID=1232801 RepID=UPI001C909893|nr:probable G-protein coupled receptor B0563.6 [Amphibalanus amphitrite]